MIKLCLLLWNVLLSVGKKSIFFIILQNKLDEVVRTWNSPELRMCLKAMSRSHNPINAETNILTNTYTLNIYRQDGDFVVMCLLVSQGKKMM